jgi:hypothetical protein
LLQRELEFNASLEGVLDTLQIATGLLDGAQDALGDNELAVALEKILQAEKVVGELRRDGGGIGNSRAVALLGRRVKTVREVIVSEVLACWGKLVGADASKQRVVVLQDSEGMGVDLMLKSTPLTYVAF